MTSAKFTESVVSLGSEEQKALLERAAGQLLRLLSNLSQQIPGVDLDELLTLALEMIPRAVSTYREGSSALSTHVVTVVRNACLSLLTKERTHSYRERAVGYDYADVPRRSSSMSQIVYDDELDLLERILSPYAWRMLGLIRQTAPAPLSGRVAGEVLGLSATSVGHLREEVQNAVRSILVESKKKKM